MNPLASRLKSQLLQSTQNLKFNLLINTNVQNIKSAFSNQPQSDRKKVAQPSSNFIPYHASQKQQLIPSKLQNKLIQLKKRSYSQRKLITQTHINSQFKHVNSQSKQQNQQVNDQSQSKRKRLISASSLSKIKPNIQFSNLTVQKRTLVNKQTSKQKYLFKDTGFERSQQKNKTVNPLFGDFIVEPNTINLQLRNPKQKLQFITPIKSQRVTNFSIDPSTSKQALQGKIINFTVKNSQVGKNQSNIKNTEIKTDKKQQLNNFISNINNTLTLFTKNGIIIDQTLDYKQLQQIIEKKKLTNLLYAQNLISHLEKIKFFVKKYQISSEIKISSIVDLQSKKVISNWQILNLFHDWKRIIQNCKNNNNIIKGVIFYFPDSKKGADLAVHKIAMFFRQIKEKKLQKKMKSLMSKVIKIQRYWRRSLTVKNFKQKLLQNAQKKLQYVSNVQKKFVQNYQIIKTSRKVEIHIGSLSFQQFKRVTFENKNHYENSQISRIFKSLESPDNFIIYVSPIQLCESVIKYYQRMFKIVTGSDVALKQKVYFIYPENTEKLSKICQLTTLNNLLYSPKALKRIKMLVKSISSFENCYILPSYPSIEYVNLSYELKVPIFSSSLTLSKLYSTKIGYREIITQIIDKQQFNQPFRLLKSVSSIFSQKELINTLALLIYKNQEVKRWYFKIDDEFNTRGLAYFNVSSINFLKKLNDSQNQELLQDVFQDEKEIIRLIVSQLKDKLKQRLKIIQKQIYPTYNQYMSHFLTRGGVIEAAPQSGISELHQMTISFVIQPNGDFQILGTFNKLQLNSKSICSTAQYPAKNCDKVDIQKIVRHLYRRIYLKKKLFGYFCIDLLVEKSKQLQKIPYVLGLSCFLTIQSSSLFLIKQLTKVRYDKDINSFLKIQATNNFTDESQSLKSSKISKLQFQKQEQNQSENSQQISSTNQLELNLIEKNNNSVSLLYCPSIWLPKLEGISQFFRKCKFQNIAFDLKTLLGSVFLPVNDLEYESIGFLISQKGQQKMNYQMQKIIEFLSKNYRNPNSKLRKQGDQVGMLRGVLLSEIHKSTQYMKAQEMIQNQRNCQATFNNLQFF